MRKWLLEATTTVVRHARRIHYRIASTKEQLWRIVADLLPSFGVEIEVPA